MARSSRGKGRKPRLGSGERFEAIEERARRSGARDAGAVAYAAGAKKHGKRKMAELAARGRRRAARARGKKGAKRGKER